MKNIELAAAILKSCWQLGVRDVILCAGARNAPFVTVLSHETPFKVHPFFEERSAGFFALGKILAGRRPVAVITTSGTAAAELLPAAIEADYQGLPLLLITADRPLRYRGTGAPQTINQIGIYSHYVAASLDVEQHWSGTLEPNLRRPLHINVGFDEPLIDSPVEPWREPAELAAGPARFFDEMMITCEMKHPLVLVGGLRESDAVAKVLSGWKRPFYLEGPSQLRGRPALREYEILGGERALKNIKYDGVIRIGSVPTVRLWRDLENLDVPVLHFSDLPHSGLPRERRVSPLRTLRHLETHFEPWTAAEREVDRRIFERQTQLLEEFNLSEPAWVKWLSRQIPQGARVFLGNSLPVREWDFAAARPESPHEVFANRGVNGIDGLVSTFLGLADREKSNWALIGDLSALYDLSGLWPSRMLGIRDLNLAILNNGGGRIFQRLFHNPLFENRHDLNFKAWAEMWNWDYLRLDRPLALPPQDRPRVLEIVPDEEQTENFWRAMEKVP